MKSTLTNCLMFAASALASVVALHSTSAQAAYVNHAPELCNPVDSSTQWYSVYNLWAPNTSAESKFMCAIRSDNQHPHGSMTSLHVYVDDRNTFNGDGGKVRVAACVAYSLSFGGACGTIAATSGTGTGFSDLTVSRTTLTANPGEYPYVFLMFPKKQSATDGYSKLFGFTSSY